jgi:hypothetical protein
MTMSETKTGMRLLDIDDPASGILAYAVDGGGITEAQADPIWRRFDEAKEAGTKIRVYAEMAGFPSVEGGVILDKLKRLWTIMSTIERMAVVGDAGWLGIYAKLVDPITKPDIKHFTSDQKDDALAWLGS